MGADNHTVQHEQILTVLLNTDYGLQGRADRTTGNNKVS